MKYSHFYIFLLIVSTIVSLYSDEKLQSFHLLNNTNFTLENGFPKYYTTYCYSPFNCTNTFTFYPDSTPNSSAIIELETSFSNFNFSLNTSYTVDSNVELMPVKTYHMVGFSGYWIFKIFVNNLTSETSLMDVWDAMDHVVRRCEVLSGGIPLSSGPECQINLQCLAYVACISNNMQRSRAQAVYIFNQVIYIFNFLMTYIIIIPYVIGLLFSVLNVVLFIQLKSLRSPFMIFVAIQSFYCIFWFLCFFFFTAFCPTLGKSLLGLQFNKLKISSKSSYIYVDNIAITLMYLCSFGIEAIRFFKAFSRVFALRFPLWSSDKLTIKYALFPCLSTFILGIIAWVFVVLSQIYAYTSESGVVNPTIRICEKPIPAIEMLSILYIVLGWGCFPQYILFDELCPLNLITLLLDLYVFFLFKLKLSQFNDQQKKRENVLKLFIVMDLIDVSYSCLRRMLFLFYAHNDLLDYTDFSSQWSMFYYNAFAKYIILALHYIDGHFFYVIRVIFYAVEMVVCQMLMRRIQAVENPHDIPRTFVDQLLLKFTKKFYTNVLRVHPTIINNPSSLVVARA